MNKNVIGSVPEGLSEDQLDRWAAIQAARIQPTRSSVARAEKKSSSRRRREPAAQEKWKEAWKDVITILLFQTEEDKYDFSYSLRVLNERLDNWRLYKKDERDRNKERIKEYMKKRTFKFGDLRYLFREETGIDFQHSDGFTTFELMQDLTNEQMFSLKRKFDLFSRWCREKLEGMTMYFNRFDDYENTDAEFSLIAESGWNNYPRQRFTTTTRKGKYGVTKGLARTRQGTINKASQRLILKIADLSRVLNFFKLEFNSIVREMGQHGIIKDIPEGRADLVNILKVIDDVNGYDEADENDSVIPELEGNIAWTKLGQQLIKPLKQKIDEEKERRRAAAPAAPATKQETSAAAPPQPQPSAAADGLDSQHYTKRKPRNKGLFKTDPKKINQILALSKRRREARRQARNNPEEAAGDSAPVAPSSAAAKPPPSAAAGESLPRGWTTHLSRRSGINYYQHNEYGSTYIHPSRFNETHLNFLRFLKDNSVKGRIHDSKSRGELIFVVKGSDGKEKAFVQDAQAIKFANSLKSKSGGRKTKRRNGKKKQTKRRKIRGRKTRKSRGRKTRKR